jgi:hypothetical protein
MALLTCIVILVLVYLIPSNALAIKFDSTQQNMDDLPKARIFTISDYKNLFSSIKKKRNR